MDEATRKIALGAVETGIYLLGSKSGEESNVMLASWICQCSFDPPRVMLGLKKDTLSNKLIKEGGGFVVNVPQSDQRELVKKFFKYEQPKEDTVHGERFQPSPVFGAPVLDAVPAWFEAKVVQWIEGGDHDVVVGEVVEGGRRVEKRFEPLTEGNSGWRYGG